MSSKIHRKRKTKKGRGLKVNADAVRILRTVRNDEAFYFYEAIGKPTGEMARSLSDFIEKTNSVKLESLLFHLQRKDFQNWIKKTLSDPKLARRIGSIPPTYNDDLRIKIHTIVENRIKELRGKSLTLLVNEELAVASLSSTS